MRGWSDDQHKQVSAGVAGAGGDREMTGPDLVVGGQCLADSEDVAITDGIDESTVEGPGEGRPFESSLMRSMSKLRSRRVGIIGYGLAGRVFHAPLITATPGLEVAAIVTSDPGRAAQARKDHPDAEVVPEADAIFVRPDQLDLVVVATPNDSHVALALRSIEAGVAVVVDKPLAAAAAEGRRLIERSEAAGVLLTVFQNRRWDNDFLTLRSLLDEDRLGRVHRFESRFERWRPQLRQETRREDPDPARAGGLLYDLGAHVIDQALVLFGPVSSVYAELTGAGPGASSTTTSSSPSPTREGYAAICGWARWSPSSVRGSGCSATGPAIPSTGSTCRKRSWSPAYAPAHRSGGWIRPVTTASWAPMSRWSGGGPHAARCLRGLLCRGGGGAGR